MTVQETIDLYKKDWNEFKKSLNWPTIIYCNNMTKGLKLADELISEKQKNGINLLPGFLNGSAHLKREYLFDNDERLRVVYVGDTPDIRGLRYSKAYIDNDIPEWYVKEGIKCYGIYQKEEPTFF